MGPRDIHAWRSCLMAQLGAYSKTVPRTLTKGFPSLVCLLHRWKENNFSLKRAVAWFTLAHGRVRAVPERIGGFLLLKRFNQPNSSLAYAIAFPVFLILRGGVLPRTSLYFERNLRDRTTSPRPAFY